MSTELVTKETNANLIKAYEDVGYEVNHKDLMIPKLLLMQATSKLISSGEARFGEVVNNVTMEIVGDFKKSFKVLPFFCKKVWTISKFENGKYNFYKVEDVTHNNLSKPYEEVIDGVKYKNEYTFNYYVLTSVSDIPAVISFRGQSETEGKKLYTQMFVVNKQMGLLPCGKWAEIKPESKSNAKGTFAVLKAKLCDVSTSEEKQACVNWLNSINNMSVVESDTAEEGATDASTNSTF